MKKEGQIILNKEEDDSKEKRKVKTEVKIEFKRLLLYGIASIFIYFLLSYSYKLILAYEDFYHLIDTYSKDRGESTQNNILVTTPNIGQKVSIPFKVEGKARTFSNMLIIQIRDHSTGAILYKEKIEVSPPEKKQFGDFSRKIEILNPLPETPRNIILELYLEASGGSKSNLTTIPLQLQ